MKTCNKCNTEKTDEDFYKSHAICKSCYIQKVKKHRSDNVDYYREYDKQRANLPHRVDARLRYAQTEEGKNAARKSQSKWAEINVIKRSAQIILGNAVNVIAHGIKNMARR